MQPIRVLIIEDCLEDYTLYSRLLGKMFDCVLHHIQYATEALEHLTTTQYNLILLDYNLPDMNAKEVMEHIKTEKYLLSGPIIILTGQGNEEIAVSSIKLGADDYLKKEDISSELLYRVINSAFERFRLAQASYEKQQEMDRFVHTIYHDLRGSLGRMKSYSDLAKKQICACTTPLLEYLTCIQEDILYVIKFLDSLLHYVEIGRSKVILVPVDLNDIVQRSIKNLEVEIKKKDAIINAQLLIQVQGEPLALTQLFQNLISNAIKYCSKQPIINIHSESKEQEVCIYISDNGVGIPKEMSEEIFKPFIRLGNHSEPQGLGLGLAICKAIINQHHASINISSQINEGSIFRINFPTQK